jgi:ABC-type Mn2+/Zn2+ transport system ATPase subunit
MLLICGSNGCGKSTLLKTLLGYFPIETGEIETHYCDEKMEYIPQLENTEIHFPLTLRDVLKLANGKKAQMNSILEYGLLSEQQLTNAWNTASGGERKRTLLTRALLKAPQVLMFDEPMNHLDDSSRKAMIRVMSQFLKSASEEDPRAIVMVCHQGLEAHERPLFDVVDLNLDFASAIRGNA